MYQYYINFNKSILNYPVSATCLEELHKSVIGKSYVHIVGQR